MDDFFSPTAFFELDNYTHKEIFNGIDEVWKVLRKIKSYCLDYLFKENEIKIPNQVIVKNKEHVYIGKGTIIEPNVYIKGPCIIGENNIIRHGAYIRENVITGNNCIIGHSTEIKNSLLLNNAAAAHFAYVGDSILGNNTNLGAGVVCANLCFDEREVSFRYNGKLVKTGMKKLGAIIGDRSQVGCNTVLNPGTFFFQGVLCFPSLNVSGTFPVKRIIKFGGRR